jgi:hypothetical protein
VHDKVYGVLGLIRAPQFVFSVDYQCLYSDVYRGSGHLRHYSQRSSERFDGRTKHTTVGRDIKDDLVGHRLKQHRMVGSGQSQSHGRTIQTKLLGF